MAGVELVRAVRSGAQMTGTAVAGPKGALGPVIVSKAAGNIASSGLYSG